MIEWKNTPDDIAQYFGFVYKITKKTPTPDEKYYYIGCKQLQKRRKRPPLKNKKRNRIDFVESDWRTYWGSSKELLKEIEHVGEDRFEKEILHLCQSKWELKYLEMMEQMKHNVLLDPRSWNGIVNIRLGTIPKNCLQQVDKLRF